MHSERHRLIYLHTPKTGGNSIQSILLPYSEDKMVLIGHRDRKDRFEVRGPVTRKKHAKLADYASALNIGSYKVAISVRHPFDRAVSFFFSPHHWMRDRGGRWELEDPHWDRGEFISNLDKLSDMSSFLVVNGAIRKPDFVIRYESIQSDFLALTDALSITPGGLPHINRSAGRDDLREATLADDDLRRIVSERYARDMELFGYA